MSSVWPSTILLLAHAYRVHLAYHIYRVVIVLFFFLRFKLTVYPIALLRPLLGGLWLRAAKASLKGVFRYSLKLLKSFVGLSTESVSAFRIYRADACSGKAFLVTAFSSLGASPCFCGNKGVRAVADKQLIVGLTGQAAEG